MKKTATLLIATLFSIGAIAQSITPQVIASAGEHFENGTHQLSWTLGELAVQTYSGANSVLTEGFHQPEIIITGIDEENLAEIDLTVFPNPTTQYINIQLRNNETNMQATVLDMSGKQVLSINIDAYQMESGFDLSGLASGGYLLQVTDEDGSFRSTHQIQKTR